MEFPAFRSPEWMASAFAPASPAASSSASLAAAAAVELQAAEGKPGGTTEGAASPTFAPLVPPAFCFRDFEPVPAYLASFPTAGLYVQRVQQVKWTIKRALFRQSLFKIQNVEVLEMKRCRQPRRLVASEIQFDAERDRRVRLSGAAPLAASSATQASSPSADASARAVSAAETPAGASAASPSSVTERLRRWRRENHRDEETLREEIWKVDRCGSLRDYRIIVSRDRATKDFFTVSVQPVAWSDWLRQKYFNFVDKTVQAEE
uniref:Uncharacterized protein n=1 Tax=Toxoplasma gondii COUG TaxID=1074873 RepID=A0A2G8Y6U7_TOXGO|nr:hypothetical protein TGCOUG_227890 [Toxoplasma gondii COUG]